MYAWSHERVRRAEYFNWGPSGDWGDLCHVPGPLRWLNQFIDQSVLLVVIGGVALGALVYGIMVLALGVKEARYC